MGNIGQGGRVAHIARGKPSAIFSSIAQVKLLLEMVYSLN